jgi:hypothetical protein
MLNKEQILAAKDFEIEIIDVPEWDGQVIVRNMTAKRRDQLEQSMFKVKGSQMANRDMSNLRAKVVALSICDQDGNFLFDLADAEALGEKSVSAIDRLFPVCQKLSKLTQEDAEAIMSNLQETPKGDSLSD